MQIKSLVTKIITTMCLFVCFMTFVACNNTFTNTFKGYNYSDIAIKRYSGTVNFSFYIDDKNNLYASGVNGLGQLGINDSRYFQRNSPVLIMQNMLKVEAAKTGFALALSNTGEVFGWGLNMHSQLGQNTPYNDDKESNKIIMPTKIPFDQKIVDIACGMYSGMALDQDGNVWSWGGNNAGQLGRNVNIGRKSVSGKPDKISGNAFGNDKVVAIECSEVAGFALTKSNKVFSWGANDAYQLGNGNLDLQNVQNEPKEITFLQDKEIVQISAASENCMALTKDGKVYIWGANNLRQLGVFDPNKIDVSPKNSAVPILLDVFADSDGAKIGNEIVVKEIACGGVVNIIVDNEGFLYTFGDSAFGSAGLNAQGGFPSNLQYIYSSKVCVPMRVNFFDPINIFELAISDPISAKEILPASKNKKDIKIAKIIGTAGVRTFVEDDNGNCWSFGNNAQGQACSGNITNATKPVVSTFFRADKYDDIIAPQDYLTIPIIVLCCTGVVFVLLIIRCEIKRSKTNKADR